MARPRTGSIRARGNSFSITFDTGKVDANGKRIRVNETHPTHELAAKRLRELAVEHDRGEIVTTKDTIAALLDLWMDAKSPGLKRGTVERYKVIIDKHVNPVIGHESYGTFRARDVEAFYSQLRVNGAGASTMDLAYAVLRNAFGYAVDVLEELPKSPIKARPVKAKKQAEITPPSLAQVQDMLALAKEQEQPLYAALWLAVHSGARRGELFAMKWANFDPIGRTIEIKESRNHAGAGTFTDTPKSGKSRTVHLDAGTVDVLLQHKASQDAYREAMGADYHDAGIMFANHEGNYYHPGSFKYMVDGLSSKTGPRCRVHDLRHFHATALLQAGVSIVTVSKRLGHASVSITLNTYGHTLSGDDAKAADTFAGSLSAGMSASPESVTSVGMDRG